MEIYGDANRRFKIAHAGLLPSPGVCITCGTVDRDCIWFGAVNFIHRPGTDGSGDSFGSVLICVLCFASAVTENPELGFITKAAHEATIEEVKEDNAKVGRVDGATDELNAALVAAIDGYRNRVSGDVPDVVAIVESKVKPPSKSNDFAGFPTVGSGKAS